MISEFEPGTLLIATLIAALGAFTQSATGFGMAIVCAPLLLLLGAQWVPVPITIAVILLSLANMSLYRHALRLRHIGSALLGRLPGTLTGAWLLLVMSPTALTMVVSVMVLFAVLLSLTPWQVKPTTGKMAVAGFLSGITGTSTAIGGPPIALLMQHEDAAAIRANLAAFFLISALMSLAVLGVVGFLAVQHFVLAAVLLPGTLLGYWLAKRIAHRFSKTHLKTATLSLCLLAVVVNLLSLFDS